MRNDELKYEYQYDTKQRYAYEIDFQIVGVSFFAEKYIITLKQKPTGGFMRCRFFCFFHKGRPPPVFVFQTKTEG